MSEKNKLQFLLERIQNGVGAFLSFLPIILKAIFELAKTVLNIGGVFTNIKPAYEKLDEAEKKVLDFIAKNKWLS